MFKVLLKREIISLFCSIYSFVFAIISLVTNGLMLWFFEGSFNIMDNGYVTLERFFSLSSILLLVLLPALTMRAFSEEKLTGTFGIQLSRPISISQLYFSKCVAILVYIFLILASSLVYLCTIYILQSTNNIDLGVIISSYFGLFLIATVFVFTGVFASSISKNSILGFVLALVINLILFFGFDLLKDSIPDISIKSILAKFSLSDFLYNLQRGVVYLDVILIIAIYLCLAWLCTLFVLGAKRINERKVSIRLVFSMVVLVLAVFLISSKQIDITKDKRFTFSDVTKNILSKTDKDQQIQVDLYLANNINYSFQQLVDATTNLVSDFNKEAEASIFINKIDYTSLDVSSKELPYRMADKGMPPITLNEKDRDGKLSQRLIYPYAQIIYNTDTLQVSLLKQVQGYTADQNINASIENLEFEFIDAINLLLNRKELDIAFVEGHDELSRAYVYEAENALAKYFNVNRGEIGYNISVLDAFKVVIIAKPQAKFSEVEKYILDQYIMKGGRVLWLMDGAYVSQSDLSAKGQSAVIRNELNLDDLFFTYGFRINPNLVQDTYALNILLSNDNAENIEVPWYYTPILLPSENNPITNNIQNIKSAYASSIDVLQNKSETKKDILLTTSSHSRIIELPTIVDFDLENINIEKDRFNESFIPIAVSLEGKFESAFKNRLLPDSLMSDADYFTKDISIDTKMIIVSSSDIIKNELIGKGEDTEVLPLGYDRLSNKIYGNSDFIVNAVNWLANDDDLLLLRTKKLEVALLDKELISANRNLYVIINVFVPLFLVISILLSASLYRRFKYTR